MAVNYYSPVKGYQEGAIGAQTIAYNKNRNALAQQELANAPGEMARRNALLDEQIKGAQQGNTQSAARFQQGNEQDDRAWGYNVALRLTQARDPNEFGALADAIASDPRAQRLGIRREMLTPERAQQIVQQQAVGAGVAPSAPVQQMETIDGPDGSLLQRDPVTGALKEVLGRRPRDPAPEKGPSAPAGYRYKADGSLEPIPGGPAAAGPKNANISEGERKAAALGTRLEGALRELSVIPVDEQKPGVLETIAGVAGETSANLARSSDRQQADAAQLDALDAALTLATGAAYTKEQLQNLRKSYFPQLGDSKATRAAKQTRFERIVQTARIAAGRAEPAINEAQSGASGSWDQPKQINGFTIRRVK